MARALVCGSCHQATVETYQKTAHFLTSARADSSTIRGSFAAGRNVLQTANPDVYFRMEQKGDSFYQTAFDHGKTHSAKFDLVMGSGRRGQSYLYWKSGLLYQLPASYAALTGGWINSPGYPDGEVHFDRVVPPQCLNCHATEGARQGQFSAGIACEKCHTGGGQHPGIRNPAILSRDAQVAICAACHSGLGDGAEADVHGNQAGLLRNSQCYRNSPAMSCSTCHNVHRVARDLAALSQRCIGCHAAGSQCKHTAERDNCIDCHMPLQDSKVITFRTAGSQLAQQYRTHRIAVYDVQTPQPQRRAAARVQFTNVAAEAGITFRHENGASAEKHMFETFGSGVGVIDFDNDGYPDLFFANGADLGHGRRSPGNVLYRNLGNGKFQDVTAKAGVAGNGTFATGATVGDYDNDGDLDIYVTNGHVTDNVKLYDPQLSYRQTDLLYENLGDGRFQDASAESGAAFRIPHVGRGAAVIDFDNDGDLDLVVTDSGGVPMLLRNDGGNRNHWLAVRARGRESNRFGIGCKVRVTAGGRTQLREINPFGSYLSTSDMRLYFGLGKEANADRLEVEWPSGKKQTLTDVAASQVLLLDESKASR